MNEPDDIDPCHLYRLSKHLYIRPASEGFVVESLVTGGSLTLPNLSSLQLLLNLVSPLRVSELVERTGERLSKAVLGFFETCLRLGIITAVSEGGVASEDQLDSLEHWEAHDLAFHLRSRRGRNSMPLGATWHLSDRVAAEPARKRQSSSICEISLPAPELIGSSAGDWSLDRVLEERRSRYSVTPVSVEALGALLYRTCRVTQVLAVDGETLVKKVYPSGGSLHSLEVYVIAHRCTGLSGGGYYYDAFDHRLLKLRRPSDDLELLLQEAGSSTGHLRDLPSVLLVFSSRFRRVARKYQSNAYRLILQETGALFQTIYLVGQSLGLSICALGGGDSDRFAKAFDTDFFAETSVGELIVGG